MGLDMYLERYDRKAVGFMSIDPNTLKNENPELYEELKPFVHKRGNPEYFEWEAFSEQVGQWRKANAIHGWFVANVQNGNDDCGDYEVSEEKLEELLETCKKVLESCVMTTGMVSAGIRFENGKTEVIYEKGKVVMDSSVAEALLPATEGFFFGSKNYDEWYVKDIAYTIQVLEEVLADTDFERYAIYYSSSW